jgi:hypothetical protein
VRSEEGEKVGKGKNIAKSRVKRWKVRKWEAERLS